MSRVPSMWTSGTGWPRSRSHVCMVAISSRWALSMRAARRWTAGLAPCVGAMAAMTRAWAWCPIIPVIKCVSASVNRS